MKNKEKFAKEILDVACEGHKIAFDKRSMKVCTWAHGATSWSATCANHWKYAVLAETK